MLPLLNAEITHPGQPDSRQSQLSVCLRPIEKQTNADNGLFSMAGFGRAMRDRLTCHQEKFMREWEKSAMMVINRHEFIETESGTQM